MSDLQSKPRDHWSGRGAFVLAAVGSAVGLGNLWGFPYKLYSFGGGAFLVPYFIAMLVMGVPLLIMEFSIGHWAQQSPPGAFGRVLKKYRFAGWWLVALAFVIITYYSVILGYCIDYLIESVRAMFTGGLPWAGGVKQATDHFYQDVLHGFKAGDFRFYGIDGWVLLGNALSWLFIYLCLFRGVKWVSKVVLLTVPLPWLMLVILTVRGLTLDGAIQGLEFYLEPNWAKLAEAETWRWAFGQVFFSMSLGFAVMLSYASFLHRKSDLNNNAMIIGLGDLATSFIAGIAVFATLGGMSLATGIPVEKVTNAGPDLAFVTFPYALAQLPLPALFSAIFFLALLTLGIDSAFSIVEAVMASIDDNTRFKRSTILPVVCIVGFVIGLLYSMDHSGLNWLGLADGLINGPFGILTVAMAECLIVGWAWNGKFVRKMRLHANQRSDWNLHGWWELIVKWIAPAFLAVLIVWSISSEVHQQIDAYHAARAAGKAFVLPWPTILGSLVFLGVPVGCWIVARKTKRLEEPADEQEVAAAREHGGVRKGVLYVLIVMLLATAVIEYLQSIKALEPSKVAHEADGTLSGTAYIILSVSALVIVGGLAWCFWRAMIAAGGRDTELPEQADEPSDSAML